VLGLRPTQPGCPDAAAPCREAWKRFAALQGGRGPYLRFANMLINDATYLLDDALNKVQVSGYMSWTGVT
jgi:Ubiquitin elongating factor core